MKVTLFWLIRHLMHGMSITNEPPYGCSPLKKSFIFLDLGLDIIGRKNSIFTFKVITAFD